MTDNNINQIRPIYEIKCREFLIAKGTGDKAILSDLYADEVILLPEHEGLKSKYGINLSGNTNDSKTISKNKMIELDLSLVQVGPKRTKEEIIELIDKGKMAFSTVQGDDTQITLSLPRTKNKKLTLPTKKGDVIMKSEPDQMYLLVLRKIDSKWKVVAEYAR